MPKMLEITSILQYEETRNNKVMKERKKGNQLIKKGKSNKVCVLHAIKHQNYLEVYAIFFAGFNQACPKYLTNL